MLCRDELHIMSSQALHSLLLNTAIGVYFHKHDNESGLGLKQTSLLKDPDL